MHKLHLNLQPQTLERKKKEFFRSYFKKLFLAELILWLFLFGGNYFLTAGIGNFKKRISSLEREWLATEPLLKERDELLLYKDNYLKLFSFLKGIFRRDFSWFAILQSLSQLVPEEMWFRELALKEALPVRILEISASVGYLDSDEEKLKKINSFLESAKQDKILAENFELPNLQDVTKTTTKGQEVLDLKFNLTLKK